MDKFRGDATFAKINENIEQLQFPGSLTLGDVGAVIALAGVHREALFFGVSKKQLTISLNKTQLLQPVTEEDVQLQQNGKRRRIENPLQEKLDKTMVALSEKIKDEVRVRHARHLRLFGLRMRCSRPREPARQKTCEGAAPAGRGAREPGTARCARLPWLSFARGTVWVTRGSRVRARSGRRGTGLALARDASRNARRGRLKGTKKRPSGARHAQS